MILQGSLHDTFDEFFVKSIENVNEEKASKDDHIIDEDSLENPLNNKFQLRVEMIPWCEIFLFSSLFLSKREKNILVLLSLYIFCKALERLLGWI